MNTRFRSEQRFHITINEHRTSFSLDKYLADLLAIKLGCEPQTQTAHSAARKYLTAQLNDDVAFDPELPIFQQARRKAIKAIADEALVEQYTDWFIGE